MGFQRMLILKALFAFIEAARNNGPQYFCYAYFDDEVIVVWLVDMVCCILTPTHDTIGLLAVVSSPGQYRGAGCPVLTPDITWAQLVTSHERVMQVVTSCVGCELGFADSAPKWKRRAYAGRPPSYNTVATGYTSWLGAFSFSLFKICSADVWSIVTMGLLSLLSCPWLSS